MSLRPICLLLMPILMIGLHADLYGADAKSKVGDRVELFAAMKANQVDVKLIPKNAEQATVIIKNKTERPLSIKLPAAFAGVPVLAQIDRGGDRGGGGGNNFGGGGNQGFGGGMGGMGMGMGGGFFNVGPDRVGKFKVPTVCLEHGKRDPNPRVPYELKPIKSFNDSPAVAELCKMLGNKEIDQVSAQAAAWHLCDKLSWDELARKVKVKHLNGRQEMYFNARHLNLAVQAVQKAQARAESERSPGEIESPGDSLSQR